MKSELGKKCSPRSELTVFSKCPSMNLRYFNNLYNRDKTACNEKWFKLNLRKHLLQYVTDYWMYPNRKGKKIPGVKIEITGKWYLRLHSQIFVYNTNITLGCKTSPKTTRKCSKLDHSFNITSQRTHWKLSHIKLTLVFHGSLEN